MELILVTVEVIFTPQWQAW